MIFDIKQLHRQSNQSGIQPPRATTTLPADNSYVVIDGEPWFCIPDSHLVPEFFTTPVTADDHWMFVSSLGAITAGRRNADNALFPYYSSDKLSDFSQSTGPLTLIRIKTPDGSAQCWRPFSTDVAPGVTRNLYKNVTGNRLLFEEVHEDLSLVFRYQWSFGYSFGFVRTCELVNLSAAPITISLLDGIQNILPAGIDQAFQLQYSNLADAYKKNELLESTGIGVYYLSSIPTDRAEPSEGLRATVAWQLGLDTPQVLLCDRQVNQFRATGHVTTETDIRGCRGAYLVQTELELGGLESADWKIIANLELDSSAVSSLRRQLQDPQALTQDVIADTNSCQNRLQAILSASDGRQSGASLRRTHRHQSNVIYNVMRGGFPADNYQIKLSEFESYLADHNCAVYQRHAEWLKSLPSTCQLPDLLESLQAQNDADLLRLGREYLPLIFSRRHGDPSRPWNRFSINLFNPDGSQRLHYEGNWRDIFQNWEALAVSWPNYTTNMIHRFVNASTADGYNPYRIMFDGIDWETPNEEAFSNIGYWGDHQIVYLLKLLEWSRKCESSTSESLLLANGCCFAQVPYRIANYQQIKQDPAHTITFDAQLDREIHQRVERLGADGKLLLDADGKIRHASMFEKLVLPAIVKMTNFIPEAGIWLNTQRPEWNDANNALVGNGASVVTACYLRRYFVFLSQWLTQLDNDCQLEITDEIWQMVVGVEQVLKQHPAGATPSEANNRRRIVDALSQIGSDYRDSLYQNGLSSVRQTVSPQQCVELFATYLIHLDNCIQSNRRDDGLYHAYNLIQWGEETIEIERLTEMLEGQVAVISSGVLSIKQTCEVLDALRNSRLYRGDQSSYTLYPDRELRRFVEKNCIASSDVENSPLLTRMLETGDTSIVSRDVDGKYHFNADFKNAYDLHDALDVVLKNAQYTSFTEQDRANVAQVYEQTFDHHSFTGRSENFFAYEGLGSIYWHMVSKLALAAIEQFVDATSADLQSSDRLTLDRLQQHYFEIRDGLGTDKSANHFGAFPTEPYSHTPAHAGAQQPGMTGQVKEDVLCRMIELGARVRSGRASFEPYLFDTAEFHSNDSTFSFVDLSDQHVDLHLAQGCFGWTWCQVPIIYHRGDKNRLDATFVDGTFNSRDTLVLTETETRELFSRQGNLKQIDVWFDPDQWTT